MTTVRMTRWLMILVALSAITCAIATSRGAGAPRRRARRAGRSEPGQARSATDRRRRRIGRGAGDESIVSRCGRKPPHPRSGLQGRRRPGAEWHRNRAIGESCRGAGAGAIRAVDHAAVGELRLRPEGVGPQNPARHDRIIGRPAGPEERWAATVTVTLRTATASGR